CEFVIVVNPLPVFDCPAYGPFCEGDDAVEFSGIGVYTFDGDVVTGFNPAEAGEYLFVYTETTAFGCTDFCEFVIVVNPLPVFDCPAYGPFCEGDDAVEFSGIGVYTFNGEVVTGFDPAEAGEYLFVYTETTAFGCVASCEFVIVVNPLPVVTISGNFEICDGESTILTASLGASYLWNTGATSRSITVTDAGEYSVVVTDVNGCIGEGSVQIIVFDLPTSYFETSETVICFGEPVTLTTYFTGVPPWTITYIENDEFTSFTTFDNPDFRIEYFNKTTVIQTVSVTDGNGCTTALNQSVTIVVNPLPVLTCPPYMRAFVNDPVVLLNSVTPYGGSYSGEGVSYDGTNYYFDPSIGIGTYQITYCYTIPTTGCESCCSFSFIVLRIPGDEQIICMPEGWSGISSYFIPDNPQVETIFADLVAENKLVIMLDDNKFYWPEQNINTLVNWNVYKGYKIKMNMAACIEISGEMPDNKTFTANNGSSYIPVLCDQPLPAEDIFNQFGDKLLFAYDLHSQLLYWPLGGIYTLEVLEPGKGYLVNMNQQGQATYNCSKSTIQNHIPAKPVDYENAPWSYEKTGSGHFISLSSSALNELVTGDFIGVFDANGACTGLTQYNGDSGNLLLVAYGDDLTTEMTDGLNEDESMFFKIYRPSSKTEILTDVTYDASMPNTGLFTDLGQSKIVSFKTGATSVSAGKISSIALHPNPSNGLINLTIPAMDEVLTIEVTEITGQVIMTEKLETSATGFKHEMDLSGVSPGVYFVRITGINQSVVKKVVIQ
ncbi:MAG: T9SS type A sorting domain-containing protein, partial [Bacteroidales bacterium]|nr:T9SS type A sorting domain-containing protein [Bacteroidales bacterium]